MSKNAIDYRTQWIGNYKAKIYFNSYAGNFDTTAYTSDSTYGNVFVTINGDSSLMIIFLPPLNWNSAQDILKQGSSFAESLKDNYIIGKIESNGFFHENFSFGYQNLGWHFNNESKS
ncbi:MAG: hypothetical protein IPK03_04580 [Bacteroidetes bacterium]|nr:hypothetical protein [Bacteroidota bacterium]